MTEESSDKPVKLYCDDHRHLICTPYSVANLHQIAAFIGIKRCWFHGGRFPHYDIPKKQRPRIEALCTKVTQRELLQMIKDGLGE